MASQQVNSMERLARLVFVLFLACIQSNGQELHVKHAPPYVVLQSQAEDKLATPLASSELHKVLGSPLGLTDHPALQSKSLLRRPKAGVVITVVSDVPLPLGGSSRVPVDWDLPYLDMEPLVSALQTRFTDPLWLDMVSDKQFFDVKSSSPLFSSLPSTLSAMKERLSQPDAVQVASPESSLNTSLTSDASLVGELQLLHDVLAKLQNHGGSSKSPDLVSLTLNGVKAIAEEHGVDSTQAKEAGELVAQHLDKLTSGLRSLYKDNVLVGVLSVPSLDAAKVRKTRSLMAVVANTDFSKLNLEIDYDGSFPVTFNICLWLLVVLSICVFFVAYGIWNMNPNLESILYRVPQDELKKNN